MAEIEEIEGTAVQEVAQLKDKAPVVESTGANPFANAPKPTWTPVDLADFSAKQSEKLKKQAIETGAPTIKPAASSTSSGSGASPSINPSGKEPEHKPKDVEFHRKTAGVVTKLYCIALSYAGQFISGDDSNEEYRISERDQNELKKELAEYLATIEYKSQLPAWLPLAILAVGITFGTIGKARKAKKRKEKAPIQKDSEAAPRFNTPMPFSANNGAMAMAAAPPPIYTPIIKAGESDVAQERTPYVPDDRLAPYWKNGNPVKESERESRERKRTPICDTCGINHVRTAESKRCSKECSSKFTNDKKRNK